MITAKTIMEKIDEALKMFGEYSYQDKGAREVIDIDEIVNELKRMQANKILEILKAVEDEHSNPDPFLQDVVMSFDDWNDPRADELFESELFQEYY